jgi:hypothetical protein
MSGSMPKPVVARIWQGRTQESLAESYAEYLYEEGVKKLRECRPSNRWLQEQGAAFAQPRR